jgi:hypothetical protein
MYATVSCNKLVIVYSIVRLKVNDSESMATQRCFRPTSVSKQMQLQMWTVQYDDEKAALCMTLIPFLCSTKQKGTRCNQTAHCPVTTERIGPLASLATRFKTSSLCIVRSWTHKKGQMMSLVLYCTCCFKSIVRRLSSCAFLA